MKKKLHAVIAVLCIVLVLAVAALIYLEVSSRSGGIEDTIPSTQGSAPVSADTTGTTAPGDTAAPGETAAPTQGATMPNFPTEDPDAMLTPEITFPENTSEGTQEGAAADGTTGVDTDDNATPDIDFE